jgi:hypothetical protein
MWIYTSTPSSAFMATGTTLLNTFVHSFRYATKKDQSEYCYTQCRRSEIKFPERILKIIIKKTEDVENKEDMKPSEPTTRAN